MGPQPQAGHTTSQRRRDAVIGLIVAVNLALVLLAPIVGSTVLRAIAAVVATLAR
jgi:hypothetical protein